MTDERGATWRVFLAEQQVKRILVVNGDDGLVIGLSRNQAPVDSFLNERSCNFKEAVSDLRGRYSLIVFGNKIIDEVANIKSIVDRFLDVGGSVIFTSVKGRRRLHQTLIACGLSVSFEIAALPARAPRLYFPLRSKIFIDTALGFHVPGSLLGRVGIRLLRLGVRMDLQFPLRRNLIVVASPAMNNGYVFESAYQEWIENCVGYRLSGLVAYAGSDSSKRKITLLAASSSTSNSDIVVKLADTEPAKAAVTQEYQVLSELADTPVFAYIPKLVFSQVQGDGALLTGQTCFPRPGSQVPALTEKHFTFLRLLTQLNYGFKPIGETYIWCEIANHFSDRPIAKQDEVIYALFMSLVGSKIERKTTQLHRIHGDFAPWNIQMTGGEFFVYDWEDSVGNGFLGSDIFCFIFRQANLVGPWKGAEKIYEELESSFFKLYQKIPGEAGFRDILSVWVIAQGITQPGQKLNELARYILER